MDRVADWLARVNLWMLFFGLAAGHGLMYFALGNPDWILLALSASLVWTTFIGGLKSVVEGRRNKAP